MELSQLEKQITDAVDKLSESVVVIKSRRFVHSFPMGIQPVEGSGSGVIVDSRGYIVTNFHVIDSSNEVQVILKDGRSFEGKYVGGDKPTDIALIKISASALPAATLADSEKLKVGQIALAIGNPLGLPGGLSMSMGVISALRRPLPGADLIFEGLIQTDAAINPGNSGGPLSDINGNVVGMNTAMIPNAQGLGFAIPANTIKWVIEQIREKGRVIRPSLGISVLALNPEMARAYGIKADRGVIVAEVVGGGPADRAGIKPSDIIKKIAGYELAGPKDLLIALAKLPLGEEIPLVILRHGQEHEARIRFD